MGTSKILQSQALTHVTPRFLTQKNIGKVAFAEDQKARIVGKYIWTESVTVIHRSFYVAMHKTLPPRDNILRWHTRFLEDGNMEHIGGNGRPRLSDQSVE